MRLIRKLRGGGLKAFLALIAAVALALSLTVAGTAAGEDSTGTDGDVAQMVKSAGKTGEVTFPEGSYIVDMGDTSSNDAQLRPYGLVYDLILNAEVPVYWVIDENKTSQTDTDLTYNGKNYISGPFVISGDDVDDNVREILNLWKRTQEAAKKDKNNQESKHKYGVTIDGPTTTSITVQESRKISSVPRVVLDKQNGSIAKNYLVYSGILSEDKKYADDRVYKEKATPDDLDSTCDDIYVMPHAEPTTSSHGSLAEFNKGGGYIWAGCHAVSYLESDTSNKGVDDGSMFFLSTNGMLIGDKHTGASKDGEKNDYYQVTGSASDPIMQFIGNTFSAHDNGAEQIYMPTTGSAWRDTTRVLEIDTQQADVIKDKSPGSAAFMLVGPGYGDYNNGMVMYEAGHEFELSDKSTAGRNAIRAFLNFIMLSGVEKSLDVKADIPSDATAGSTVNASVTVTKGTAPYTYEWTSDCNASFSDPTGSSTSITFPDEGPCHVKVKVTDQCSRSSFETQLVDVKARKGSVVWSKTDADGNALAGSTWKLTGPNGYSKTIVDNGNEDEDTSQGSFKVTDLEMGDYSLVEIEAPDGFQTDSQSYAFTISSDNPDYVFDTGFVNKPTPIELNVTGSKTITGRDSNAGETFKFTLVPADSDTEQAVNDGVVTVSDGENVGDLTDGEAKDFTLRNFTVGKAGTYTFTASEDQSYCSSDLACSKAEYNVTITATGGMASTGGLQATIAVEQVKDDEGKSVDHIAFGKTQFVNKRDSNTVLPLTGASAARNNTVFGLAIIIAAIALTVFNARRVIQ